MKQKAKLRRLLSCLLALLMMVSVVPVVSADYTEPTTGTTEDGLEYEIFYGRVEITGYSGTSSEVEIPATIESYPVTSIGNKAFYNCQILTSISIPKGLESVDEEAFKYCYKLDNVTIPSTVESIGKSAFAHCFGLTNVTILEGVTDIREGAFWECTNLKSITIPVSVRSIGPTAFLGCRNLSSVEIPEMVNTIGTEVFSGCVNLKRISVDGNNKTYDSRDNCNAIIETSTNTLIQGTGNTTIPSSVTSIGDGAFSQFSGITNITIPPSVTSIGRYAFSNCYELINITIPDGITSIGDSAFSYTAYYENPDNWQDGVLYLDYALLDAENNYHDKYIIKEGTTIISDNAFSWCENLETISIPSSVISIGKDAFKSSAYYENSSNWQDGVLYIDSALIEAKYELNGDYSIKEGTTIIADHAFSRCKNLNTVSIPSSVTNIGTGAFMNCYNLTSVEIPSSVTNIGEETFYACASLANAIIPKSVKSIGNSAFKSCSSLTNITIPEGVTSIGDNAFDFCLSLTNITIPKSVTNIGDGAFAFCEGLKSIIIPNGVTSIGQSAFYNCTNLTNITIPDSITSIGYGAFDWCVNLTNIIVDENNMVFDSRDNCNAIIETKTDTLVVGCKNTLIPSSVTRIGEGAFYDCTNLTSITIPDSITSIGYGAFDWCVNLTDVYYSGTQEQWNAIEIGYYNDALQIATIHYNYGAPTEPSDEDYVTDTSTGISVATNTDAELVVSEVTSDKDIVADINFILVGEKVKRAFDITLQKDGTEVQPDGNVWIKIPAENPDSKIYRMEADGTLTDMNAEYKDGYLIFTTEHFSIYVLAEPGEPDITYILGDANSDGKVNVKDGTQIQKFVAGMLSLDETQTLAADVDGNGKVNVRDATAIQKWVAGIDTGFDIGK